jgi:hypothetical protein
MFSTKSPILSKPADAAAVIESFSIISVESPRKNAYSDSDLIETKPYETTITTVNAATAFVALFIVIADVRILRDVCLPILRTGVEELV